MSRNVIRNISKFSNAEEILDKWAMGGLGGASRGISMEDKQDGWGLSSHCSLSSGASDLPMVLYL